MDKDIADLKAVQRRLGDSVSWIVDTLLLDEGVADSQDQAKTVRERKREAVECLSYVRDVLKGTVSPDRIEDDRLVGEEELKRRQAKKLEQEADMNKAPETATIIPALPLPVATAPPSLQTHPSSTTRRTHDYFTVGPSLTRVPMKVPSAMQAAHPQTRSPSPTPTVSILSPNQNAVPLAPWNHSFSSFTVRESPIASLPRLASKPPGTAHSSTSRVTPSLPPSQTPSGDKRPRDQPPPRQQQDPLGVLR